MCFALSWNTGFSVIFIQISLSQRIIVVSKSMSNSHNIIFLKPYGFPTSGERYNVLFLAVLFSWKYTPPTNKSCFPNMNGSDLEQNTNTKC